MGYSRDTAGKRFPIGRVLIALVVVSILTPLIVLLYPGMASGPRWYDFVALFVVSLLLAWPGCLTFLVLGLPTLYLLFRTNHIGFPIFALFGGLYTALPWVVLQIIQRPPRGKFLQLVPMFFAIGLINGILTRLIVFGRRP
jgi:hypothetical protein